ncbi:hypothetical protein GLYMA_06G265900v4 [Glycine max]|uniref:hAT-like transposase RNase-H fold domain-containing protein n=1 Tax=Glycine max TaxID=3847 RepID=A0A0R0JLZ7_SOYBN|nr:hypothetical protein GLYMA_06G265900v4 [Glycine max]
MIRMRYYILGFASIFRLPEANNQENEHEEPVVGRKRKKTSVVWNDFDEMEISPGYCKSKFATGGTGSSTTHLHSKSCIQKKAKTTAESRQPTIPFQPSNSNNPFMIRGVRYSNKKMREIIATTIMVHEYPFSVVEDSIWMWAFQYANPDFHKVTHKTARNDCLALIEMEKKILKKLLESVSKISLTIDIWKSCHQCLKTWGIENKVFSISMDNASYNDSCIRCLKENISLSSKLFLGGSLFHVRCCAHMLNLLVQDGLSTIKDIIFNIRESVKYINHNDARLKAFCDVVEWNSTFNILLTTLKFKTAFASYNEREPHYNYAPSLEEWNQVEKVCKLLEVFNLAPHVISGSEYPTANLYLAEVWKVKQILDKEIKDEDLFMREMVGPMKKKFDKYWGECNMLMAIASVLDPRCKFHMVKSSFEELYDEYVGLCLQESTSSVANLDDNISSSSQLNTLVVTGFDEIMSIYVPNTNSFSALDSWRNNSMKYKILSKMTADILAIPISTVAFKILRNFKF